MKDILLIGGPTTLTGVDRIDDDVLSILSAEGLYDRKAVVVWPTKSFLSLTRHVRREFVEGGVKLGGRFVTKGLGWWLAGACIAWDLADHHKLVRKNLPVLRQSIGAYLVELQEQVLRDQRCGILVVLQEVQRGVLVEVEGGGDED